MKHIVLASILFIQFYCLAQTKEYNATIIYDSLNAKVHRMEVTLYDAAINNKIKAYKNDSLTSFYQPGELKHNVAVSEVYTKVDLHPLHVTDTFNTTIFDPFKDGKGLAAYYKPASDINDPNQTFKLSSLAFMYAPTSGQTDIRLPIQSLFFVRYDEWKTILSPREINFIVLLSNLLQSDKHSGDYHIDGADIKMPVNCFYSEGVSYEFKKFSYMNEVSLKAISNSAFDQSIQFIYDDIFKFNTSYYTDATLKTKYSNNTLNSIVTVPITIEVYPNPKDLSIKIDSIIMGRIGEKSFTGITCDSNSISIITGTPQKKTISMRREDFDRIAPRWLSAFITIVSSEW